MGSSFGGSGFVILLNTRVILNVSLECNSADPGLGEGGGAGCCTAPAEFASAERREYLAGVPPPDKFDK